MPLRLPGVHLERDRDVCRRHLVAVRRREDARPQETCNGLDDDCDNQVDEGLSRPYYTGPTGTAGKGICAAGTEVCSTGNWVVGTEQVLPRQETCNNEDDNCNDEIDEGIPPERCFPTGYPAGVGCEGDTCKGICRFGMRSCVPGSGWGGCTSPVLPQTEACNGVDDDCDGTVDSPFAGGPCNNGLLGICNANGSEVCLPGGRLECQVQNPVTPVIELCDCLDNNCNGTVDEGVSRECYTGPGGTAGVGVCHVGFQVCTSTASGACAADTWSVCAGEKTPEADEKCNGLDDDCDGQIDEGLSRPYYTGPPGTSGVGICGPGLEACVLGTWTVDVAQVLPGQEACNDVDDDCNGQVDDGVAAAVCYDGTVGCDLVSGACVGECRLGSKQCVNGSYGQCEGQVLPREEECNGLDEDCDSLIDNPPPGGQLPGEGVACTTPSGCPGEMVCDQGLHTLVCKGHAGGTEICNGRDDDCDDLIDEEPGPGEPALCDETGTLCAGPTTTCTPAPEEIAPWDHVCAPGHYECLEGAIACVDYVLPEEEVCDGLDNDCDGQVDDGDLCDPGSICYRGECVPSCKDDEFPCPGSRVCVESLRAGRPAHALRAAGQGRVLLRAVPVLGQELRRRGDLHRARRRVPQPV